MNLKELTEKRADYKNKMAELLNTAKTEERAMNEEEVKYFDDYEKEVASLDKTIERMEKMEKMEEKTVKKDEMTVEERDSKTFVDYIRATLENRATNMTTGDNGAIIPQTIAQKIISKAYDMSTILAKATKYNTKGKLAIPVYEEDSSNSITMAYSEEFAELSSNIGNMKSVDLNGYLAGALALVSKSLIANTDIDLETVVVNLMAQAIARFQEKECLQGTEGKVRGLKDVKLEVTAKSNSAITAEELIQLKNKVKKGFRANAVWIMSNETLTAIELLKDNDGKFIFHEDMTGEHNGYILGYPVEVSDNMDDIAADKTVIYFGDFSGLALKQRNDAVELNILRERYATQHAVGFNAWVEFDAKVENAQKIAKLVMAS